MYEKKTFLRNITAENLDEVLCSMSCDENKQQELIFPDGMIEHICEEKQYPCYRFAHNLEGHIYMRARVKHVTVEYLVIPNGKEQEGKEAHVCQITFNGDLIYKKPDTPNGKIYVL